MSRQQAWRVHPTLHDVAVEPAKDDDRPARLRRLEPRIARFEEELRPTLVVGGGQTPAGGQRLSLGSSISRVQSG
jgi:hypothetical protein